MIQKTVIGDVDPNGPRKGDGPDSLYGRSAESANIKRTFIQGMKPRTEEGNNDSANNAEPDHRVRNIELQERPLAGILYSVSADGCGEIFPLYVGRNSIGSKSDSDVYLTEQTVSPSHAILLIRVIETEAGRNVTMSITDYDSEYGTAVNGYRLGYDREQLHGNEIIQIGNAYSFVFIPLDAMAYGLGTAKGFVPVPRKENHPAPHPADPISRLQADTDIYPTSVGASDEHAFYGRSVAKKEDHSSKKTFNA